MSDQKTDHYMLKRLDFESQLTHHSDDEEINKMKNNLIKDKVITVRHLFSEDIIVTTDMIAIKKLLEQNFK
jgi:hypothetical protein